jgi:hypothetical protein
MPDKWTDRRYGGIPNSKEGRLPQQHIPTSTANSTRADEPILGATAAQGMCPCRVLGACPRQPVRARGDRRAWTDDIIEAHNHA